MELVQTETKHCPICTKDLPVSEFGLCNARKDRKNLYCKSCIRQKVSDQRKALKEYKAVRKTYAQQQASLEEQYGEDTAKSMRKLPPVERVKEAVANGARTQREIAHETKLSKDVIGDALADLLLWTLEIRTQVVDGTRLYFLNTVAEVERKPCVTSKPLMEYAKSLGPQVKGEKSIRRVA